MSDDHSQTTIAREKLRELNGFIQQSRSGQMLTEYQMEVQDEIHRRIGEIIELLS